MRLGRRGALLAVSAALAARPTRAASAMAGELFGADAALGHRLRGGGLPEPTATERTGVVIVGGGIAGLSAAWRLRRLGFEDVVLVELEGEVGGNARGGRNAVSAYPWGAHYVPLLTAESVHAQELFAELGIIIGRDSGGLPIYDELALCADPRERLFLYQRWQEDLLPEIGVTEADRRQYRAFFAAMDLYRAARGSDGRKAFAIPVVFSSEDAAFRALDTISMAEFMRQHGWDCAPLRWYVEYCCRDDYGTNLDGVSAWAGVHYFAARDGRAGGDDATQSVLTWPEGNGHIVAGLKALVAPALCSALAWRVSPLDGGVAVDIYEPARGASRRLQARAVILATPRFVADRLLARPGEADFTYAPWMVANVTVARMPEGQGAPLCWDNVIYGSRSLGYVVATHQLLEQARNKTVLTYYWPLSDVPPSEARHMMLMRRLPAWQ